jgi:hypothetical protein
MRWSQQPQPQVQRWWCHFPHSKTPPRTPHQVRPSAPGRGPLPCQSTRQVQLSAAKLFSKSQRSNWRAIPHSTNTCVRSHGAQPLPGPEQHPSRPVECCPCDISLATTHGWGSSFLLLQQGTGTGQACLLAYCSMSSTARPPGRSLATAWPPLCVVAGKQQRPDAVASACCVTTGIPGHVPHG